MQKNIFILLFLATCAIGCQQNKVPNTTDPKNKMDAEPVLTKVDGSTYVKDFGAYWDYKNNSIRLYEEYSTLDTNLAPISKDRFFKQLATGNFIALRVAAVKNYYQLFAVPDSTNKDFKYNIGYFAKHDYTQFQMENKAVPTFRFTDIRGNVYTPENTKGKILVLKCWFIGCKPCVAEMPELNKLVDRYADRKDILFISLAIDDKQPLISFLKTTEFKYQTVSNQEEYMEKKLHVFGYPTHIVVDKNGMVRKTVDGVGTLAYVIDAVDKGEKI